MSDIGFPLDSEYIANQHFFYESAQPKVIVWVESYDDKRFWLEVFKSLDSYSFEFKFPFEFQSEDGKSANGCSRLLKLISTGELVLGLNQIICMDSDFNFISSFCDGYAFDGRDLEHIYWTRVHSKENVALFPAMVDEVLSHVVGVPLRELDQPASVVLRNFSRIVNESVRRISFLWAFSRRVGGIDDALIAIHQLLKNNLFDAVNSIKGIRGVSAIDFEANPNWIEFVEKVTSVEVCAGNILVERELTDEYDRYCEGLSGSGVDDSCIYYFLRGHDIYDVMTYLFNSIARRYKSKFLAVIDENASSDDARVSGRKALVKGWQDFSTVLSARAPLIHQVPFFKDTVREIHERYV